MPCRPPALSIKDGWIQEAPPERRSYSDDVADGQTLMLEALRAGVTAAFCYNDMYAVGALMTCRELGIRVPDQVSIVGFDDVELAQYVTPPLTTVHQPKLRLGQLAMEMLLGLMEDQPVEDQLVPLELVVRCSTAHAPPVMFHVAPDAGLSRPPLPVDTARQGRCLAVAQAGRRKAMPLLKRGCLSMRQYTAENLVIHPGNSADPDVIVEVTPANAGWDTIHFQARRLAAGSAWSFQTDGHELALVVLGGTLDVTSDRGAWRGLGRRANVFAGCRTRSTFHATRPSPSPR